jgi:hypothetical protein
MLGVVPLLSLVDGLSAVRLPRRPVLPRVSQLALLAAVAVGVLAMAGATPARDRGELAERGLGLAREGLGAAADFLSAPPHLGCETDSLMPPTLSLGEERISVPEPRLAEAGCDDW